MEGIFKKSSNMRDIPKIRLIYPHLPYFFMYFGKFCIENVRVTSLRIYEFCENLTA